MNVPHSQNSWSALCGPRADYQFRTFDRRGIPTLWRKHITPAAYGGYIICTIPLGHRWADEWIAESGLVLESVTA